MDEKSKYGKLKSPSRGLSATRIPGLKQPAVKEILKKEQINESNEVELLKRFGQKTISNPYELELV